jgi:hypothetical protein
MMVAAVPIRKNIPIKYLLPGNYFFSNARSMEFNIVD